MSAKANAAAAPAAPPSAPRPAYLESLSAAQYSACAAHPARPTQILAGPGSGKTRVLTSRAAWLVLEKKVMPEDIVVITFTNKAANEMRKRLDALIGSEKCSRLVLGTFHATVARYLRRFGRLINLPNNFLVVSADDSKKMLKEILKNEFPGGVNGMQLKPEQCLDGISSAKSRELTAHQWLNDINALKAKEKAETGRSTSTEVKRAVCSVYFAYERALKAIDGLDFDDLLVKGCQLLRIDGVLDNLVHVLVDEFQDTNTIQYSIMSLFARATTGNLVRSPGLIGADWPQDGPPPVGLSIVGDPDQAIYGWRNAEVTNLAKMRDEFEGTYSVNLEENYRSTGAILEASLKIVEQDADRIAKGLFTSHPHGLPVVLTNHEKQADEAQWIASEIKRLIAYSGGVLNCDDFAILLRYNALSREIERALQAEHLPSRMMGGNKFFDRTEIKDILAYLTLADNPHYTPAFLRVINVPKRGIGDKTLSILHEEAHDAGISIMEHTEKIIGGAKSSAVARPAVKSALREFVKIVTKIRSMGKKERPVSKLIDHILTSGYLEHLRKNPEFDSRYENVKELVAFSNNVAEQGKDAAKPGEGGGTQGYSDSDEFGSDDEELDMDEYEKIEEEVICSQSQILPSSQSQSQSFNVKDEEEEEDVKPAEQKPLKRAHEDDEKADRKVAPRTSGGTTMSLRSRASAGSSKSAPIELDDDEEDSSQVMFKDEPALDREALKSEEGAENPLRQFLSACVLSTDLTDDAEEAVPKVTIATCHAAKGLEFGVTFVCGVMNGVFPFFRCTEPHEIAEERRLLYVACTRAQSLLYLTWSSVRNNWKGTENTSLSHFVAPLADKVSFRGGTFIGASAALPSAIDVKPDAAVGGGGFEVKGAPRSPAKGKIKVPKEPIPFSNERPVIARAQIEEIAQILERKLPDDLDSRLKKDIEAFENSPTAKKVAEDEDQSILAPIRNNRNDKYDNGNYSQYSQQPMRTNSQMNAGSSSSAASWGSLKTELKPSQGFTKASALVRNTSAFSTPMPLPKKEVKPPPSFTDQYRLGSQGAAGNAVVIDGQSSSSKPVDLERFESTAKAGLQDLKNLLPADLPAAPVASSSAAPPVKSTASASASAAKPKKAASSAPSISRAAALGMTRKAPTSNRGWRRRR